VKKKIEFHKDKIKKKAETANFESLSRVGGAIRLTASRSILRRTKRKRHGASAPGTPPHSSGPLKKAIYYSADKNSVVVGPTFSRIGVIGSVHEFGGVFRKRKYPRRPYMEPAFEKMKPRIPAQWSGSLRR